MSTLSEMIKRKKVAVWGMGYLGYTTALVLQSRGLEIEFFDPVGDSKSEYLKGDYPNSWQRYAWSRTGNMPPLKEQSVSICEHPDELFQSGVEVHIVCLPATYRHEDYNSNMQKLKELFLKGLKNLNGCLVIFQSASGPGTLRRDFFLPLVESFPELEVATAFRADWNLEDFFSEKSAQMISGFSSKAADSAAQLYSFLGFQVELLDSVEEAEFIENSKNALEFCVNSFLNQLTLGYPDIDIRKCSAKILQRMSLEKYKPNISLGEYRMPTAVEHLLRESVYTEHLSLLNETLSSQFTMIMELVDYIIRHDLGPVTILGLGVGSDITMSTSLVIAERLIANDVEVCLHDPAHPARRIKSLLPQSGTFAFEEGIPKETKTILIQSDWFGYRNIDQEQINLTVDGFVEQVFDGSGVWSHLEFKQTKYDQIGNGALDLLR